MWRTGMCRFGVGNWIFLFACFHLFTYAQGGEDPLDFGVRFTSEPSDAVIAPGEAALLACSATSRRAIRLAWRHSVVSPPTRDHGITDTDKYRKQLPNGSLSITEMSASLAGQYQCVATVDGVGTILSRVATVFLAEVPDVAGGPRSVLGAAGGAALLACGVRAPPRLALRLHTAAPPDRRVYGATRLHNAPPMLKLNVTWLKNGSPMRVDSARMSLTPSGALEIEPLRHHDSARYACRVALANDPQIFKTSEETELRVSAETPNVESPPRFIATPQPVTVMEGASVTFDCAAVGNPKPEITWLNNGAAIDLSDLDSRFYLVGSGSLRVQQARALDAGAYTCRAHSRLDSADHTTQLHVLTSPRVQMGASGALAARARGDVTLRCEVRGRPPPSVTWLKDGDPLSPNNHDIALLDGTSLRIQGVLRVDAGMFQCAATSAAGSAIAAVRLMVLPPDDDISNITIEVPNSTHDIFTSLVSSDQDHTLDPTPEDPDFLGETSSAYTSGPDLEYDDYDSDVDFHAAEGLDLDLDLDLKSGNASLVSAPRGLKAVIVKHRFVTLSWEEPQHKAEEVTGYAVIYKVKGSERERVARGGPSRHEMNVASLQPNTTYQFTVLAYTEHGTSPPTDMVEVRTSEEEVTHGPPLNLRGEAVGPHTLRLTWSPPVAQPPPTKYSIHYTEVDSGREQFQWVETEPATSTITSTLTGLRAASTYVLRVAGAGGAPAELRVKTPADAPAAPPANVTVVATSATSILVRWEAPPSRTHRGALTGYKVRYRAVGAAAGGAGPAGSPPGSTAGRRKADSLTTPADQRRAELRGLDTATTYQIRVCAINVNGSGPFSEWVTASTQRQELDESRVPPQPPPLTTRAGRDWISVWWGEEEGGVLVRGYVLGWGLGVPDDAARELPAHLHSHVIRGLESNAEYVISLRASNSRGLGPAVYATVRTKPPAADEDELDDGDEEGDDEDERDEPPPLIPPVGVKVIMLSGTTAVVYWTDPTLPKGQTATDGRRYVVRWSSAGGRVRSFNATDLNCMLDELRPYTQYEFAVKLIKGGRESAWSMLVSNTTLEAAPGSGPRELRAAPPPPPASAARALDLAWQPPAKPNGLITGYVIMYAVSRGGEEEWTAIAALGERTRARVERLRPRTTYLIKLQARNSKGLGPFCPPITYTTAMGKGNLYDDLICIF
ncbi:neogenin-like [Trichoplusia ni]|uniref:Hemolin n=1 Tax=Trichoplusia ni TaxID=7111 RepID=A0A7E5WPS0_TRINI|nr:neogenin-like [Trichoplusia ni]